MMPDSEMRLLASIGGFLGLDIDGGGGEGLMPLVYAAGAAWVLVVLLVTLGYRRHRQLSKRLDELARAVAAQRPPKERD